MMGINSATGLAMFAETKVSMIAWIAFIRVQSFSTAFVQRPCDDVGSIPYIVEWWIDGEKLAVDRCPDGGE